MTEQEVRLVELVIEQVKRTELELTQQRTELAYRIEELAKVKQELVRLLPPDKRIDRLFS